jgi:hypothetical protein
MLRCVRGRGLWANGRVDGMHSEGTRLSASVSCGCW